MAKEAGPDAGSLSLWEPVAGGGQRRALGSSGERPGTAARAGVGRAVSDRGTESSDAL